MGQQQLLLIILGVIIVGVAIAVGISLFSGQSTAANRDAMLSDINNIGADGYQYKIKPTSMGGGNGVYTGYALPTAYSTNPNATYTATAAATTLTVLGVSKQDGTHQLQIVFAIDGAAGTVTYPGVTW